MNMSDHFCDNPVCPNHKLPMNDERHYHIEDADVFGPICNIVKTHSYKHITYETTIRHNWLIFKGKVISPIIKYFNFCDVCMSAINIIKRNDYDI